MSTTIVHEEVVPQKTTVSFSPFSQGTKAVEVETTLAVVSDEGMEKFENNKQFGLFRILDQKHGDKRLVWNRLNMGDISEAHRMFDRFNGEGLQAYRVGGDGKAGERMTKFDPTAEEVIFLPMKLVVGG